MCIKKTSITIFTLVCIFLITGCYDTIVGVYVEPQSDVAQLIIDCPKGATNRFHINKGSIPDTYGTSFVQTKLPVGTESFIDFIITGYYDYKDAEITLYYTPTSKADVLTLTVIWKKGGVCSLNAKKTGGVIRDVKISSAN